MQMLYLFRKYLKPYALLVIFACVFTFLQVLAELQLPAIMANIVDIGIYHQDLNYVLLLGLQMLAWALGSVACVVIAALCAARSAMGFGRDIRSALFRAVQRYSLIEFNEFGTSTLITRNTNDVQQVERFTQMLMTMAVMTPAMFIGACVMAFQANAEMASIIFFAIPIIILIVVIFLKIGMPLLRSLQARIDAVNRVMREGLTGVRVVRAYNREAYEQKRFHTVNRDLSETYVKVGRLMGAVMPLLMFVLNVTIVALYWFGSGAIDAGRLSAGEIMALVQYVTLVLMSLMMLSMIFAILPRTLAACERITAVLSVTSQIKDPESRSVQYSSTLNRPIMVFDNVEYCFNEAQTSCVSGISFELNPQTTTVLLGPTGSGKSVITQLMLRLLDPIKGAVYFEGVNMRDLAQADIRRRVAYVPQQSVLFSGTIAENMRIGNEAATDEEIWEALRIAQAAEFVSEHEEGLDYHITQGGQNLSGGQRQRLAIARALIKSADLYIFDDSFSALDFKTDALVRHGIKEKLSQACVFIVSQRVSVGLDADNVILLDGEGSLEAQGTHDELFLANQTYRELALSQLSEAELRGEFADGSAAKEHQISHRQQDSCHKARNTFSDMPPQTAGGES